MVRSDPSSTIILQIIKLLLLLECCWLSDGNFVTFLSDLLLRRLKNLNILENYLKNKNKQVKTVVLNDIKFALLKRGERRCDCVIHREFLGVGIVFNATHLKKEISQAFFQ